MKNNRLIFVFLILFILILTVGCGTKTKDEPKQSVTNTSKRTEDLPTKKEADITKEPETTEGVEQEEIVGTEQEIEGAPELVWQYKYENEERDTTIDSIATFGDVVATGQYCVSYIHHLSDGTLMEAYPYRHTAENLEFSPDGSMLGAGLAMWGVDLIDLTANTEAQNISHSHNNCLAFSPDGKQIVTGNRDGILWIWELDTLMQTDALEHPDLKDRKPMEKTVTAIDYHPSGKLLAATHWDNDGTIYIWDVEEKEVIRTLQSAAQHGINIFRFSPSGKEMACIVEHDFDEYLIRLIAVDDGEVIQEIQFPAKKVSDLSFSPDGNLLAVATLGEPIRVWNLASGDLLYTLDQEIAPLEDTPYLNNAPDKVRFTDDGGHLVFASRWAGTLELWRLPGAEPIADRVFDAKLPPPLPGDVLFDTASAKLKQEALPELETLAEELYANFKKATITFIGHTDSQGDAKSNLDLSTDRAQVIKDWFQNWADEKGDLDWILLVDGKGDTELKIEDVDADGKFIDDAGKLNRRVEIEIKD